MKIIEDFFESEYDLIEIKEANFIGDFAIRILFNDGHNILVDFKPFLLKSLHPSIKKYLNEELFTHFKLQDGNLNWNDYDMIFPVIDLYNGKI